MLDKIVRFLDKVVKIKYVLWIAIGIVLYRCYTVYIVMEPMANVMKHLSYDNQKPKEEIYQDILEEITTYKSCDQNCQYSIEELLEFRSFIVDDRRDLKIEMILNQKYRNNQSLIEVIQKSDNCNDGCKNFLSGVEKSLHLIAENSNIRNPKYIKITYEAN